MPENIRSATLGKSTYPLTVSLTMIVVAILLSFVDLAFLNEVIGKVLDIGAVESMAIAFALGLIGIAIMAHLGIKEAHEHVLLRKKIAHYLLWISLGFAIVLIRLFSASIMQLDNSLGDNSMINLYGIDVREVDLVLSPLMLFLYVATGILAKDGFKNLLMNPEYDNWWVSWREARNKKKSEDDERRAKAERQRVRERDEAERKKRLREKEVEDDRLKQKTLLEEGRIKNALNGNYGNALKHYRAKESEIKDKYQKISANIEYISSIDKQENDFESKVKPSLQRIVQDSIYSVQNNVALAVRKKTGEEITELHNVIKNYNNGHNENS